MNTFTKRQFFLLSFIFFFASDGWSALQSFTKINPSGTHNVQGNYAIAGNTVLCLTENTSGYGGTCQDSGYENITSNMRVSKYIDIDDDNSTWNSSSSYITFPTTFDTPSSGGDGVLWAGIFWQGRISYDKDYVMHYGRENGTSVNYIETGHGSTPTLPTNLNGTGVHNIKLKIDNGNYNDVTSNTLYEYSSSNGITYAAYADVTSIIRAGVQTSGKHVFTLANLTTNEGREPSPGVFGGWSLVVIYAEDSSGKMRNISVYSGFDIVGSPSDAFEITDFILPRSNTVNATLALFAGEGETRYAVDWIKISPDGTNYDYMPGARDDDNIFDAVFTGIYRDHITGHSNNLQVNNDGVDVDIFDVSALMTDYRDDNQNLNSLYIQWYSNNDYITPSMLVFATELYAPKFCYDYAYKQQGIYFTESNDGTKMPRLVGNVVPNEDIEMKIFIRNLVDSDLEVTDMNISVLDINTSQTIYIRETTKIAKIGDLTPQSISDSLLTVSDSFIKSIDAGTVRSNDYFYIYYSLNPLITDLNGTIDVRANYNLTLNGVTIPYSLQLGKSMEICSTSDFRYAPAKGIFTIVHNNYYDIDSGGSNQYYNLPTQVTQRVGNFKVLSMDPDNLDVRKETSTIVAVEMIDASAFHDTNASCMELASSVSERVWVTFDNNTTSTQFNKTALDNAILKGATKLLTSEDFYSVAKQNTAFRVSYNTTNDGNSSLIDHTYNQSNDTYKINNFTQLVQNIGTCSQPVTFPTGNSSVTTSQVAVACGNAGTYISKAHYTACMECLYGINTRLVCSRDNFSIRPEAFLIQLDDQNQTNPINRSDITNLNDSGAVGATQSQLHLAAGYQYKIEINATNHLNNSASSGYTKTMNLDTNNIAKYIWSPQASLTCNDESNQSINTHNSVRFLNGFIDMNTSLDQVGFYHLTVKDTTWTTVDSDPAAMQHHSGSYFTNTRDCNILSSDVKTTNFTMNPSDTTTLNGCNITSEHLNVDNLIQYNDYNVTFHPYKFDVNTITPTIGLLHQPVSAIAPYLYIADISNAQDENMSYHLNGNIIARGENNVTLSNFVDKCYAVPLDINISTSNRDLNDSHSNHVDYKVRFHDINSSGSVITALDINVTDDNTTSHTDDLLLQTVQTPTKGYFPKNLNGTMRTLLNMNYAREKDTTINPTSLTFIKYQVNCTNVSSDCTFNADLVNNKTTQGIKDLNATVPIRHYYGRTHAPRTTVKGQDGNVSIYYEVFCNGGTCNKTLLQDGNNSTFTDDPRWFVNTKHSNGAGTAAQTATKQKNSNHVSITREADGNHPDYIGVHYNGNSGYPYKATMENNASSWLIYNKYNPNATTNEFEVEFISPSSDWAGVHETNATTNKNASDNTNRRLMW